LVCQNQSIDDSDAQVARDLRLLVRERITAGDTDDEVLKYLTDRDGAFVRMRPPLTASTLALWIAPALVVLFAMAGGALYIRSRRVAGGDAVPLSEDEERALRDVLAARKEPQRGD
ncbi:MAG: cytochrome c-type biogenesis protein, partial [Pseudomonadota bacterium]